MNKIIKATLFCSMFLTVINVHSMIISISEQQPTITDVSIQEDESCVLGLCDSHLTAQIAMDSEYIRAVSYEPDICDLSVNEPMCVSVSYESNLITLDSISMKNPHGVVIDTDAVTVNVDKLIEEYNSSEENPTWDNKDRMETLRVLWNFLVEQQGLPATNVAGILGNIYEEGEFSEQQSTGFYLTSIDDARLYLGTGIEGFGCAQWTYYERQETLLKYYELAYNIYPDNWDATKIIAECAMLLEECKAFNVFDDIYTPIDIEDATGRFATMYEAYGGCLTQWACWDNYYHLVSEEGTGAERLRYAKLIYYYFTEK